MNQKVEISLESLSQLIQDDLSTLLDRLPDEAISLACQIVVNRIKEYQDSIK